MIQFKIHILADKTGPTPAAGQAWPVAGVAIEGGPPAELDLPTSFVRRHLGSEWLLVENARAVQRPSQPDPDFDDNGSAIVSADQDGEAHKFWHYDSISFVTVDGLAKYRVAAQPDKYVNDAGLDEPVTREHYDAGNTRVAHYYRLVLEG